MVVPKVATVPRRDVRVCWASVVLEVCAGCAVCVVNGLGGGCSGLSALGFCAFAEHSLAQFLRRGEVFASLEENVQALR